MKKISILTFMVFSFHFSFGQAITKEDCDILQALYNVKYLSALNWEYTLPGNIDRDMGNCDCDQASDRPDYTDLDTWNGITLNVGQTAITELDLYDKITSIPVELFNSDDGLKDLRVLSLGGANSLSSNTDFATVAVPPTGVTVLDTLEELYWHSDDQNDDIPLLSQVGGANLRLLDFRNFSNLMDYTASNFDDIEDISTLEILRLINMTKSVGGHWDLKDITRDSRSVITELFLDNAFEHSGGADWYPAAYLNDWDELLYFRFRNVTMPGGTDVELPAGELFDTTNFPKLRILDLSNCSFDGTMPYKAFHIASLDELYLQGNVMSGYALPTALNKTHGLQKYWTNGNDLATTDITNLGQFEYLTSLKDLFMTDCNIVAPISALDLEGHPMEKIVVSENGFSGPIPEYYGQFDLDYFNVAFSYLTYCPELNANENEELNFCIMNDNFFALDDIYRASQNSQCNLVAQDNINESRFSVVNQRERVLPTRVINLSTASIANARYDQTNGLYTTTISGTGIDNVRHRNSIIRLTAIDAIDVAHKDNIPATYKWVRYSGSNPADGSTGNSSTSWSYNWQEDDNTTHADNGHTWYCEVFLTDPTGCPEATDDEFYKEFVMEVGHTTITYNESDPTTYSAAGPGSSSRVENGNVETGSKHADGFQKINSGSFPDETAPSLKVYPNPTNHTILIESAQTVNRVVVYDLSGQLVYRAAGGDKMIKVDLTSLDQGTYIIKAELASGETITSRVLKGE